MSKRLLFFISLIFFSLLPLTPVLAVDSPVLDQRCFTAPECEAARIAIGQPDPGGFYQGPEVAEACHGQIYGSDGRLADAGFCLPASTANLQVSIGGRKDFPNIAEYIKYVYRYSVFAALTIAVVMVIFAGLQWILAGGQSDKISAAKKRITNAIIGLLLIGTSYTILNTINPALVNLRLPQVWMIRAQSLQSPYCGNVASSTSLFLARTGGVEAPVVEGAEPDPVPQNMARCGNDYTIANSGQMCQGSVCMTSGGAPDPNQMCLPINPDVTPIQETPTCKEAKFVLYLKPDITSNFMNSIVGDSFAALLIDNIENRWIDTDGGVYLYAVCKPNHSKFPSVSGSVITSGSSPVLSQDKITFIPGADGVLGSYLIVLSDRAVSNVLNGACLDNTVDSISGFIVMTEIKIAQDVNDINLYITPSLTSAGMQVVPTKIGSRNEIFTGSTIYEFDYNRIINGNGIFATVSLDYRTIYNLNNSDSKDVYIGESNETGTQFD